ncbi:MAG: hypothetical protein DRQ61_08530 [Gammaproteobacteria bacterium]|nr:MAG: hypothetical protein DRQ61_08530 [Gammaproteobacteria bacterium]
MRGKSLSKDTNKHIELADGLAKSIREKYFRYEGFTLTSTAISEYHYLEADSNFRWLSVFLRFYDDYGRSVTTVVRAEYRLVEGKIIVESAIIMPLSSHNPRVKLYYVPVDKLSDQRFTKNSSYKEILWFVQEKAVAINIPEQVPHKRQNYWIFAFVTDRLAKDAKIELRASKSQKGLKGDNTKAKTLNFDNWFITRARGEFAFGQVDRVFYKVVYSSDSDVSAEKKKLQIIGVFSTQ